MSVMGSVTTPQSANAMLRGMHAWEGGLPQERGADEVTRTARRAEEGAYGGGTRVKRVLLVEDHRLIREGLAVMLEERTDLKKTVQAGANEVLSTASSGENIVGVVQRLVGG
jgi:hypothetical protein